MDNNTNNEEEENEEEEKEGELFSDIATEDSLDLEYDIDDLPL